jgi:hypothetical protein
MSKPIEKAEKSPVIESMLEGFSKLLGNPRSVAFKLQTCVTCNGPAKDFDSATSEKEYTISGMCQDCQDSIWG